MGNSQQAGRLCEMLLEQAPACNWALGRDLSFHAVYGNAAAFFERPAADLAGRNLLDVLPSPQHAAWRQRLDRVFCGEIVLFREKRSARLFSVALYPLRESGALEFAGGWALDITPMGAAEQELRNTALNVMHAQESERARLARMLHDEVGQGLSAAGLQLDLLRMDLEEAVPSISTRTGEVQQLLENLMQRVREFSHELNASTVERSGLHAALDRLVGRVRREFTGTLRLMADSSVRVPPEAGTALFKIAREALENAVRHSGGTLVEVQLKSTRRGPALEVRDNGQGFDPAEAGPARPGLGLLVMEHCATEAGLEFSVNSNRVQGTIVRAIWGGTPAGGDD